jgi:crotonobetaine/carnitine-CoA ligase
VPDSGIAQTIPTLFRSAVDDAADATWLLAGDDAYTFGDALGRIERVAAWCRAAGIGPGDRVLVTAKSRPEFLLLWLGLMEAGATQVPIDPRASQAEIAGFVGQVEPSVIVTDADLAPTVLAAASAVGASAPVVDVADVLAAEPDGRGPADIDPGDVAVMIPTSGTTGRSKLVMQTHRAYVMAGEGFPFWLRLTAEDRLMTSLPLFHINAPAYSTLGSVAARAGLVLLPAFSASTFLDSARRYGATEFNAIGAMLEILLRQPERPDDADTPLRICYTGPSPSRERQEEIEARYGLEVICGYALSESPYGLVWPHGTRPYGALGAARQHPTLGVVNEARVQDQDESGVGELELRNPAIMRGYYEMPEETAAVIVDGWLRTGDMVHDDGDGIYTFVGRRKEVIRRRGENLSPPRWKRPPRPTRTWPKPRSSGCRPSCPRRRSRRSSSPPRAAPSTSTPWTPTCGTGSRSSRCRATTRWWASCPTPQPAAWPSTSSPGTARPARWTWRPAPVTDQRPRSAIGSSTRDSITLAARDLPSEIMGRLSLTELTYLLLAGREPSAGERRLLDASLVSLADHGLTPSALAARLTWTGAPEAIQGAVAAGLLGAGSVFLGPAGDTAVFLAEALAAHDGPTDDAALASVARTAVAGPDGRGPAGARAGPPGPPRRRPPHPPALRHRRGGGVARTARPPAPGRGRRP